MSDKRKNHKFDFITDTCETCGVVRRKIPVVGTGFNTTLSNRFKTEYSKDGVTFSAEFINCVPADAKPK